MLITVIAFVSKVMLSAGAQRVSITNTALDESLSLKRDVRHQFHIQTHIPFISLIDHYTTITHLLLHNVNGIAIAFIAHSSKDDRRC